MGDDKPFECTAPGCGMRFTNEDHLGVHIEKHKMSLSLTPEGYKTSFLSFVADQTPTPTKFLRNCEEMGLFHELAKNPFEESFKRATESFTLENKTLDLHEGSPFHGEHEAIDHLQTDHLQADHLHPDTLDTPNPGILLALVGDSSIRRQTTNVSKACSATTSNSHATAYFPGPDLETGSTVTGEAPVKPSISVGRMYSSPLQSAATEQNPLVSSKLKSGTLQLIHDVCMKSDTISDSDRRSIEMMEGMEAVDDASQDYDEGPDSEVSNCESSSRPMSVFGSDMISVTTPASVVTSASEVGGMCFLQVMIKSPNGDIVPVHIPAAISSTMAMTSASSSAVFGSQPSSKVAVGGRSSKPLSVLAASPQPSSAGISQGVARSTKQRLKAAIQQNVQQSVLQSNMQIMSDAVDFITTQQQQQQQLKPDTLRASSSLVRMSISPQGPSSSKSLSLVDICQQVQLQDADTSTPKKPRLSSSEDDPDDRRKKFLERNRAAAARCRQKKKVWMNKLEQKADELDVSNNMLQTEVIHLRAEVVRLKTLLLAHQDCPVTLRQKALQGEMQSDHVTSSSPVRLAANAEEIAMAALSTMASRASRPISVPGLAIVVPKTEIEPNL